MVVAAQQNEGEQIIEEIYALAAEYDRLYNQTGRIRNSARPGASAHYRDGSVTTCEDAHDAMIITAGQRQRMTEIARRVKELYARALELGMQDHVAIAHLTKRYEN